MFLVKWVGRKPSVTLPVWLRSGARICRLRRTLLLASGKQVVQRVPLSGSRRRRSNDLFIIKSRTAASIPGGISEVPLLLRRLWLIPNTFIALVRHFFLCA
jgi:hypothetical protein